MIGQTQVLTSPAVAVGRDLEKYVGRSNQSRAMENRFGTRARKDSRQGEIGRDVQALLDRCCRHCCTSRSESVRHLFHPWIDPADARCILDPEGAPQGHRDTEESW